MAKKNTGKAHQLTKNIFDRICADIAEGMDRKSATGKHGFTPRHLRYVMDKNEDWAAQFNAAESKGAEFYRGEIIQLARANSHSWKAMTWLAERIHPGAFGDPTKQVLRKNEHKERAEIEAKENGTELVLPENPRFRIKEYGPANLNVEFSSKDADDEDEIDNAQEALKKYK